MIHTIAFDADDTLWHNEIIFTDTHERFRALFDEQCDPERVAKELYATEIRNLEIFGYGIKGFGLSMIETAIELSEGKVTGAQLQGILDGVKAMLAAPVNVLEGVTETLKELSGDFELMVITKGDLFDQETKIARSGLGDLFRHVEVVSEKSPAHYRTALHKYNLDPARFLMVGNSIKSDVLPVIELGARAVHVPYQTTWQHEVVAEEEYADVRFETLRSIRELPALVWSLHTA
ncbi:MAG: HAD family hydrolase [Planctomycetota bacterium]|nr:HAD family hydrolase [Planctomycetota bacterium]